MISDKKSVLFFLININNTYLNIFLFLLILLIIFINLSIKGFGFINLEEKLITN